MLKRSNDDNNNNYNNNKNNDNNNNNNLYLKRVTQSKGNDLPWGPLACLQVARGPQGYKVVEYIAFRYRDLKEGRDAISMHSQKHYLFKSMRLPLKVVKNQFWYDKISIGPQYIMKHFVVVMNRGVQVHIVTIASDTGFRCTIDWPHLLETIKHSKCFGKLFSHFLIYALTLMLLVANLANTKWRKKAEIWPKPWHTGALRVLS